MTDTELQAAVAELDKRAKAIDPASFVTLVVWPNRYGVTAHCFLKTMSVSHEGSIPEVALSKASEFIAERDPEATAAWFTVEPAPAETKPAEGE